MLWLKRSYLVLNKEKKTRKQERKLTESLHLTVKIARRLNDKMTSAHEIFSILPVFSQFLWNLGTLVKRNKNQLCHYSRAFFSVCFLSCTRHSRGRHSCCLACLHSHIIVCLLQLWIKTSDLDYFIWATCIIIIIKVLACGLVFSHLIGFFSCNTITFQKYFLKVYGSQYM